ncbi:ATPase [Trypanosoma cruzi]|uniref:ATPase n=1 Tax=Trypanosoma cruzi TaxID=5693 RepID=A0A7J6XVW2_TRYCR|nr:ATPase [Trypanosoma cruzi]
MFFKIIFVCFKKKKIISVFSFLLLGAITMDVFFFFSSLPSLIVSCCTLPVRGAVCFPPNCSTRTPTDTLMTTALCASPAARMRRGRDERRAEGAVTCGRARRACGAEHTFLSLLFCCFYCQGGQTPAAPHTRSHTLSVFGDFFAFCVHFTRWQCRQHFSFPRDDFSFAALTLPMGRRDSRHVCVFLSLPSTHTRVTVLCGPHSHADERAEGSSNTQMTHEI